MLKTFVSRIQKIVWAQRARENNSAQPREKSKWIEFEVENLEAAAPRLSPKTAKPDEKTEDGFRL